MGKGNSLIVISSLFHIIYINAQLNYKSEDVSASTRLSNAVLEMCKKHDSNMRPVRNQNDTLRILYGLRLIKIDIGEKDNILHSSVWIRQRWHHDYLFWDPEDFGGITRLTVPSSWIWTPDISLVNTADTETSERAAEVTIHNDGGIFWLLHRKFQSACLINITRYPFDEQKCDLWLQSLSYPSNEMDLQTYISYRRNVSEPFDLDTYLSDFKRADEWEIMRANAKRVRPKEAGEKLMWSGRVALRFTLEVRRRTGFTAYLLTLPCVILGSLSMLIFVLPPERADRTALGMTLLSSYVMLLLILVNTAPPSAAAIPMLGKLYTANIMIVVLSLTLSTLVANITWRGSKGLAMPHALDKIFVQWLGKIMLCRCQTDKHKNKPSSFMMVKSDAMGSTDHTMGIETTTVEDHNSSAINDPVVSNLQQIQTQIRSIERDLKTLSSEKNTEKTVKNPHIAKWKCLAVVIDRLCLCIQVVLISLALLLFMPR